MTRRDRDRLKCSILVDVDLYFVLYPGPEHSTMSRLSRAHLKARESVFTAGPDHYLGDTQAICPPSLEECVAAMEDCCDEVRLNIQCIDPIHIIS